MDEVEQENGGDGTIYQINPAPQDPLSMLAMAVEKGFDADQLGKLVDLQEPWQRARAEEAYNAAMVECQKEMPHVLRTKKNTETGKLFAPAESINAAAQPVYTKHGFSISFGTLKSETAGLYHVYGDCQHATGHTKRCILHDVSLDNVGPKGAPNKTQIQGQMSSLTYAQGRIIKLVFGTITEDEDNDGRGAFIGPDEVGEINDLIKECRDAKIPFNFDKFLAWLQVPSLDQLTHVDYAKAIHEINRKRREQKPKPSREPGEEG